MDAEAREKNIEEETKDEQQQQQQLEERPNEGGTEGVDVNKTLYDAEEFLTNFSGLRLENDQLKRNNDELQSQLAKAQQDLQQLLIDKDNLEANLQQEREEHKEELWKIRGEIQKVQEERLQWKEKYLNIYMKINDNESSSTKSRKRKSGLPSDSEEFFTNLSSTYGLTNQDEHPVAVIILKKKTVFDSNGEVNYSYSGDRHEIDRSNQVPSNNLHEKYDDNDEEEEEEEEDSRINKRRKTFSPLKPNAMRPTSQKQTSLARKQMPEFNIVIDKQPISSKLLEGLQNNPSSANCSDTMNQIPVKVQNSELSRGFSKRQKPSNSRDLDEEINNAAEISAALDFEDEECTDNGNSKMECDETTTTTEEDMKIPPDDGSDEEDHKLVKRKQFLEENKAEYFKIDELQLATFNEKIEESVQVLKFSDDTRKQYMCTICHKVSSENYFAKAHAKIHFKQRPYKCKKCKRGFKDMLSLNSHVNVKHRDVKFDCPSCPARFGSTGGLYKHLRKSGHRVNGDDN